MSAPFPPRRLANSLIRQLRLKRKARLLHVGCGAGETVRLLRRGGIEAFGVFDSAVPPAATEQTQIPGIQPATLHQSLPFPAQSFDVVVVQQASDYEGPLGSPEACTATANLLAALKPAGRFIFCGTADLARFQTHLAQFPGQGRLLTLGTGGLLHLSLWIVGRSRPGLPALRFTLPVEPISRLEWHRMARKAVASLNRPEAATASQPAADSPAA